MAARLREWALKRPAHDAVDEMRDGVGQERAAEKSRPLGRAKAFVAFFLPRRLDQAVALKKADAAAYRQCAHRVAICVIDYFPRGCRSPPLLSMSAKACPCSAKRTYLNGRSESGCPQSSTKGIARPALDVTVHRFGANEVTIIFVGYHLHGTCALPLSPRTPFSHTAWPCGPLDVGYAR